MHYRSSLFVAITACLLVGLSGCSSSSFIGRQFSNFTAYYNGFYNAKQAFRTGKQSVEGTPQPINRNRYLSIFPEAQSGQGSGTSTGNQSFDAAIKKSADLLRNHPQSKWVDEALLLIGKSYYYQDNFVGSEQKFREILTIESDLKDEARFWLARTLMASGEYTEAIDIVTERLSDAEELDDWTAKMQVMLGELYVRQEEWGQAADALEQGLEAVDDNRMGSRGQFLLGQVYETLEDYDAAARAYDRVQEFNPLYELSYAAQVNFVRVVGIHGDPQRALELVGDMQRDDKHFNKRAELALIRARILQAAGQPYDARALYEDILYGDLQFGTQNIDSQVQYRLAELYRDELNAYPLAAAYFDSAATGNRGAGMTDSEPVRYAPDAIANVSEQADRYRQFTDQIQEVNRLDSLLHLGSLSPSAFDSVITQIRVRRAEEARRRAERREEQEARQNFQSRSRSLQNQSSRGETTGRQSAVEAARSGDAGFLFHDNPVQVQQSRSKFRMTWGDRPLVPNWRRREAIRGRTASTDTAEAAGDSAAVAAVNPEGGDASTAMLPPVNTSDVPRDSAAQAEMRDRRAEIWYRLGNTLFLQLNQPDSAATWYRRVITDDETRPVAQRAFYALSEVYRAQGDTAAARRLYRQILDKYPASSFASRARTHLQGPQEGDAVGRDSLQRAREAYARAYHTWQDEKDYGEAVDRMLSVARSFTTTSVAPRALLAAGYIYLEWAQKDSLAVDSAIPLGEPSMCCGSITGLSNIRQATARADSTGIPDSLFVQPVYLKSLYASLEDSYPGTPHADRARRVRESVFAEESPVGIDSAAVAADSTAVPDTTGQEGQLAPAVDSTAAQPAPNDNQQQPPADTSAAADQRLPVQPDSAAANRTDRPDPAPSDSAAAPSVSDETPPANAPVDSSSDDALKGVEP